MADRDESTAVPGHPGSGAARRPRADPATSHGLRPAPPGRVGGIQILRGIAATLVVGFHLYRAGVDHSDYSGLFALFTNGEAGVDLFFVISGFIIFYTSVGKRHSPWRFLALRFWRIFPPYWSLLVLTIGLLLAETWLTGVRPERLDFDHAIRSFLLLPNDQPIIAMAWTLSIEVIFYLIFTASFFRFGPRGFFIAMGIWVVLSQIYTHQEAVRTMGLGLLLFSGSLEFVYGAAIAVLALSGRTPLQIPALILGSLWLIALVTGHLDLRTEWFRREFTAGLPSALVVYGVLGIRRKLPDILHLWGESSYLLYLSHLFVFAIVGQTVRRGFGYEVYAQSWTMVGMLALSVVLAMLATRYLERPYQAWYHRWLKRPAPG